MGIGLAIGAYAQVPQSPPTTVDPQTAADARIAMLEKQVAALEKKLADAESRCTQLQSQNASLLRRQGDVPPTPSSVDDPKPGVSGQRPGYPAPDASNSHPEPISATTSPVESTRQIIAIPDVQWGKKGAYEKQALISGLAGTALKLTPFDTTLAVKTVDASHLSMVIHKTSKALGTDSTVEAGKLWVENGSLYLLWAQGDQSAALEGLRYASLEISDEQGKTSTTYGFINPQVVALPLDKNAPVSLELPATVAAKVKLTVKGPTGGLAGIHGQ